MNDLRPQILKICLIKKLIMVMNTKIILIPTDNFNREVKKLSKKYRSLKKDIKLLGLSLQQNPTMGTSLGNNVYKVRMAITSKDKGKSAGARIITFILIQDQVMYLMAIYDKSEKENISDKEIKYLIKQINIKKI